MAYPKPLSEKSLAKMYRDANLDERKSAFLHQFFQAAANLYGAAVMADLWEILKAIAGQYGMTDLKRKDLIAFSSIARRENVPYHVYEVDELYSEEKRAMLDRIIVHKSLVRVGYGKMIAFYELAELQSEHTFYIPEDFLSYVEPKPTPAEIQLLEFLKNLKVTASEYVNSYGRKYVCTHVGETLESFSFRNAMETSEYEWYSGENPQHKIRNERQLQELDARTSGSEAEKILRSYKENRNLGYFPPARDIQAVSDELSEVGVQLTDQQFSDLVELLMLVNNTSHLWHNYGWAPVDLARQHPIKVPTSVSFGPGIRQAFAEGKLSREEIEEECRKRGIKIVE